MQLGVGGTCGDYWRSATSATATTTGACSSPTSGTTSALALAACGLRRDKGAPPAGGSEAAYHQAACNYYGACADGVANYADEVMARAKLYGFVGGTATDPAGLPVVDQRAGLGCSGAPIAAGDGEFIVDPGANRPGADLAPQLVGFVRRMAVFLPRPPIVTTGDQPQPDDHERQAVRPLDGQCRGLRLSSQRIPRHWWWLRRQDRARRVPRRRRTDFDRSSQGPQRRALHDPTRRAADPDHLEDASGRKTTTTTFTSGSGARIRSAAKSGSHRRNNCAEFWGPRSRARSRGAMLM